MDCGCCHPSDPHNDARHITLAELQAAADATGISITRAAINIIRTLIAIRAETIDVNDATADA